MCPARRGEWWNRLCLDLEHLNRQEQALEACPGPWLMMPPSMCCVRCLADGSATGSPQDSRAADEVCSSPCAG